MASLEDILTDLLRVRSRLDIEMRGTAEPRKHSFSVGKDFGVQGVPGLLREFILFGSLPPFVNGEREQHADSHDQDFEDRLGRKIFPASPVGLDDIRADVRQC